MSWQAELKSAERLQSGVLRMVFGYAHADGRTFDETLDFQRMQHPGDNFVVGHAKQILTNLEAQDAFFDTLTPGKITIPDPPVPSDADIFFAKYAEMKAKQIAVEKGLLAADDATLAALAVEVKSLYRDEYTKDLRWAG